MSFNRAFRRNTQRRRVVKIKNSDLLNSIEGLNDLRTMKLPVKASYTFSLVVRKLGMYLETYNEEVKKMRADFPILEVKLPEDATAEAKAAHLAATTVAVAALEKRLREELLPLEIEIDQKSIPLSLLVDRDGKEVDVNVGTMGSLWWLFESPVLPPAAIPAATP
jgi:hypothetical protein